MGMHSYVVAFRDLVGDFEKMLKARKFCDENNLSYPKEVTEYFGKRIKYSEDDLREEMSEVNIDKIVREYSGDMLDGFEIDVKDIPAEVKTIRFVNSY